MQPKYSPAKIAKLHDKIANLKAEVADWKSSHSGKSRQLTNLRKRTRILVDYLNKRVVPQLGTTRQSQCRAHVNAVHKLVR